MGHRAGPRIFPKLAELLLNSKHVHGRPQTCTPGEEKGFSVKRKRRVAELEHRVERAFLAISIAVLVLVLLGILIVVRRSV